MGGKCSNPDCPAPISCHEGHPEVSSCPNWSKENIQKKTSPVKSLRTDKGNLPWSGDAFKLDDLQQISYRNTPIIFGILGRVNAGKTTYLAMLFTLLLRGKRFKEYNFSGSKTIHAWDELYHNLKVQHDKVKFPDTTPVEYNRLLHLALRNSGGQLKDILFTDVSGEAFSLWAQNRDDMNAENARWVYQNSSAFILFIDCQDLIDRKNRAKTEVIDLAQRLRENLKNRPVLAVWSKADKKANIDERIKGPLISELNEMFDNFYEMDISNFSAIDPDALVHENNILVIDWLLSKTIVNSDITFDMPIESKDLFLNFRGHE